MQMQTGNMIKVITLLDTKSLEKVTREIDSIELAKALKNEEKTIIGKLLINLPKTTAKNLIKDFEFTGSVPEEEVKLSQDKVLSVIQRLEETGKIAV